jgi:hypothetical protein
LPLATVWVLQSVGKPQPVLAFGDGTQTRLPIHIALFPIVDDSHQRLPDCDVLPSLPNPHKETKQPVAFFSSLSDDANLLVAQHHLPFLWCYPFDST